ncbi:Hsp70 family protein [Patescibacteria group bacterium]
MEYPYYALDFGTTNSAIAICENEKNNRILEIDPKTKIPQTVRSLLCIERTGDITIGEEAVKRYIEAVATIPQNVKQKMKLAVTVDTRGVVQKANFREALSDYKGYDVPARLFQSPKMLLRYLGTSTAVFGENYSVQDIAFLFLRELKRKADKITGKKIKRVVCGRPVRFAKENFKNKYAIKNLDEVLKRLGFKEIEYVLEPVAAAKNFANQLKTRAKILVFDCGGGTTDISIMDAGNKTKEVLANAGVPKAGNNFNEEIFYYRFTPQLGQGTTYGRKSLPISDSIFQSISHWIPQFEIPREKVLEILYEILKTAREPEKIQKLIITLEKSLTWEMFEEIENKKKKLSKARNVKLDYDNWAVDIHTELSRDGFEAYIREPVQEILGGIDEALKQANLNTSDIEYVLRVGGSSLVPLVSRSLEEKFGEKKVVSQNIFTDIISGLMQNPS